MIIMCNSIYIHLHIINNSITETQNKIINDIWSKNKINLVEKAQIDKKKGATLPDPLHL